MAATFAYRAHQNQRPGHPPGDGGVSSSPRGLSERVRAVVIAVIVAVAAACALTAPAIASTISSSRVATHTTHRAQARRSAATAGARARVARVHHTAGAKLATSPLTGMKWYVDPDSDAAVQEAAWQSSDPAAADEIAPLATQPTADWFGGWNANITTAVSTRVQAAASAGSVAQLVAYDIPERDCGGYSSGGAASPSAYEGWISGFAAGIGTHPAIVILEPDALAGLDCLSAGDQATRLSLLRYAVSVLTSRAGVHVYLDAGHSGWQTPKVMARRLQEAGIAQAQGFSLNVSNFDATSSEIAYGTGVSALVNGKHFVIDTSRNGNGSDAQWCNPSGRALGMDPTAATGDALVDAFLWIKTPGESDGTCGGGPAAGTWWAFYALELAQSAA
jgi:endoglucanase